MKPIVILQHQHQATLVRFLSETVLNLVKCLSAVLPMNAFPFSGNAMAPRIVWMEATKPDVQTVAILSQKVRLRRKVLHRIVHKISGDASQVRSAKSNFLKYL